MSENGPPRISHIGRKSASASIGTVKVSLGSGGSIVKLGTNADDTNTAVILSVPLPDKPLEDRIEEALTITRQKFRWGSPAESED
jgi:hypothetical protein